MTAPCCDSHTTPVCCDPIDCGPCCHNCPTCPALHPELVTWLGPEARAVFADTASVRAHFEDDPRYWTGGYLDDMGHYRCHDHTLRRAAQLRWAHLAAVLDPDRYRDLPRDFYERQVTALQAGHTTRALHSDT